MERSIVLRIKSLGEGEGYVARSDQVRDLFACGKTVDETVENARDVVEALIESCAEHGDSSPIETEAPKIIEKRIAVPAC
jgi:predicted RNase H-like HicB family nuclease